MANTRETMGEQACLDALVANTLTSFEDDGVTKVGANCLQYHTALTDVTLSQCKSVEANGLADCTNLEVVDMLGNGTIAGEAFRGDTKLTHLLLRGASKTTLALINAFRDTPIVLGNGAIYVPSNLLATYKADSKWSRLFITTLDKYPLSDFSTIEDDWATIISKAEAGTASESYSIGDTKMIDLGTEGKVYAQIAGFGVDPLASDGTKTAGITFVTKDTLATTHRMNPYNTGAQGTGGNGGWEYCEMRTYLSDTILPMFPSPLQTAIKSVTKYSGNIVPGESTVTKDGCVTQDKLWIPSHREVFGESTYEETGPVYSNLFNSASTRTKYEQNGSSSYWWLRSAKAATAFCYVTNSGNAYNNRADYDFGVVLGFCV